MLNSVPSRYSNSSLGCYVHCLNTNAHSYALDVGCNVVLFCSLCLKCVTTGCLQIRAISRSQKLTSSSIVQQLQETHARAEESYWANVAETAKLRASHLRSSDFNAYLEEVNKEGNQFVGKLLQESASCLTQTLDRLQAQKPARASGVARTSIATCVLRSACCTYTPLAVANCQYLTIVFYAAGSRTNDLSGIRNATDSWTILAKRIPADLQGSLPSLQTALHDHQVEGLSWMVWFAQRLLFMAFAAPLLPALEPSSRKHETLGCRLASMICLSMASWQMRWVCCFLHICLP